MKRVTHVIPFTPRSTSVPHNKRVTHVHGLSVTHVPGSDLRTLPGVVRRYPGCYYPGSYHEEVRKDNTRGTR